MRTYAVSIFVLAGVAIVACSAPANHSGFTEGSSTTSSGANSSGAPGGGGGGGSSSGGSFNTADGGTANTGTCAPNPANAEIANNGCDDDADGTVDNVPTCDSGLTINGAAGDFAKSMGMCDSASSRGFGVVSAEYSNGFGRSSAPHDGQWGLLPKFGSVLVPREGKMLGALSSGYAREFDALSGSSTPFFQPAPLDGESYPTGAAPSGFPRAASGCQQDNLVNDMIDVKITLKAPPNATGFQFDFDFHSSEWPAFICTNFNDAFIAYLTAPSFNGGQGDNISFDSKNDPVSVNNGFFDRCTPNSPTGCGDGNAPTGTSACPGGPNELGGTGFGLTGTPQSAPTCDQNQPQTTGGATGWLTTQTKVAAGEQFTLELMIWDAGDGVLDSLVLLDNFQWIGGAVTPGTTRPPR